MQCCVKKQPNLFFCFSSIGFSVGQRRSSARRRSSEPLCLLFVPLSLPPGQKPTPDSPGRPLPEPCLEDGRFLRRRRRRSECSLPVLWQWAATTTIASARYHSRPALNLVEIDVDFFLPAPSPLLLLLPPPLSHGRSPSWRCHWQRDLRSSVGLTAPASGERWPAWRVVWKFPFWRFLLVSSRRKSRKSGIRDEYFRPSSNPGGGGKSD